MTGPGSPMARHLQIVHLSDLHFGDHHRFRAAKAADGKVPREASAAELAELLATDLAGLDTDIPTIVCITGDLSNTADLSEFDDAERFLEKILSISNLAKRISKNEIFLVPGNHDVTYEHEKLSHRWLNWTDFFNRFYGTAIRRDQPVEFANVYDRSTDLGAVILTLNTSIFVQRGTEDQNRGRIDEDQLARIEMMLREIPEATLNSSIKVAMMHHHPILIPALVEGGRGYDAVYNSGKLLVRLRKFGFHVVLHGHKHLPATFIDDLTIANQSVSEHPFFIASAGSAGSADLPPGQNLSNTYSWMRVALHPDSGQWRVRHETRALRTFDCDNTELLYSQWKFERQKVVDKFFYAGTTRPPVKRASAEKFINAEWSAHEKQRKDEYRRTRFNMPVVEVYPSLMRGQVYEARLWIVPHRPELREIPQSITWSAGDKFPVVTVKAEHDARFAASLAYYGPMLVQVVMRFQDGYEATAYIYARLPVSYV